MPKSEGPQAEHDIGLGTRPRPQLALRRRLISLLYHPVNPLHTKTMAIEVVSLPVPPSADAEKLKNFGREVKGVNPGALSPQEFEEIHNLLYKVTRCAMDRQSAC